MSFKQLNDLSDSAGDIGIVPAIIHVSLSIFIYSASLYRDNKYPEIGQKIFQKLWQLIAPRFFYVPTFFLFVLVPKQEIISIAFY